MDIKIVTSIDDKDELYEVESKLKTEEFNDFTKLHMMRMNQDLSPLGAQSMSSWKQGEK